MFILKYGTILNVPRGLLCRVSLLEDLFKCSLCLGFWTGVVVGTFNWLIITQDNKLLLLPFVSSACCWIIDNANNTLQSVEILLDKYIEEKRKK